ncbi:MAG: endonuclease/exonuclease/phosphatase family metal-dependent hydrolase [Myxococcota bacterium]|jgi:endonuclease/exonuclease/phosphatase family metal-dependent hydrolase
MPPALAPATVPLHESAEVLGGISLISYNVLLPNSADGWWVFKYYDAEVPDSARIWPHRQGLLSATLLGAMADIVCIQEARGETFTDDFGFMAEAGYDAEIHRKYMLRPATFWRRDAFTRIHTSHKDKVLITVLRSVAEPNRVISVLNGHLTAAPQPERRFRQVFDALDQLRKDLKRLEIPAEQAAVVVCGDFNAAPGDSATHHLLSGGTIDADFREPAWPERSLSSKPRRHIFAPFTEAYQHTLGHPPVTLLGSRIAGLLDEDGAPTDTLMSAIDTMFSQFATAPDRMEWSEAEAWLVAINRAPDRGSEHRKARAVVTEKGEPWLSRAEFAGVYASELSDGKFWSVLHDLQVSGVQLDGERGLYEASLDRIYASGLTIRAAWDPLTPQQRADLFGGGVGLPNAHHPSDHLPLGAIFTWN